MFRLLSYETLSIMSFILQTTFISFIRVELAGADRAKRVDFVLLAKSAVLITGDAVCRSCGIGMLSIDLCRELIEEGKSGSV
jgi:hypothetical protein